MADVKNPRVGDTFYWLGRTRCEVVAETLRPGDGNKDEAVVQVETVSGTPYLFLYKTSARYLSAKHIGYFKKWPLTPAASR